MSSKRRKATAFDVLMAGSNSKRARLLKKSPLKRSKCSAPKSIENRQPTIQLSLDIGQKHIGTRSCLDCGMVYCQGQEDDERTHAKFHKMVSDGIPFPGWKNERIAAEGDDWKVLVVHPDDPDGKCAKTAQILNMVNTVLGMTGESSYCEVKQKVFLYISNKRVGGCVVAESLKQAFQHIPLSDDQTEYRSRSPMKENDTCPNPCQCEESKESVNAGCSGCSNPEVSADHRTQTMDIRDDSRLMCSTVPSPCVVGVRKIWVHGKARRRGVATKLVDQIRSHFIYGYVIPKKEVAFSQPTRMGKRFALRYLKNPRFLVYK
eukprot:96745_1